MADMPASTAKLLFGPDSVPGIQEPLPQLIASGKLTLDTHTYSRICLSGCLGFPSDWNSKQPTINVSSGFSLPGEPIRPLGIASGRRRKRRLRGVLEVGGLAISEVWVGFPLLR